MDTAKTAIKIEVFDTVKSVAHHAAVLIAENARAAVGARGRFVVAISGGRTPWLMLRELAKENVPWERTHIVQTDERVAPFGHPDRNLTHLRESLLERVSLPPEHVHAMPVESADLEAAAARYSRTLCETAGTPPVLDLIHLGLGADGHTASLVPGDPVLDVNSSDVGLTEIYQGRRRMTLTYPILNRCRNILWIVTGAEKAAALMRLCNRDPSIPAGRVRQERATVLADFTITGHTQET